MSPNSIIYLQGQMNMQLEGKMDIWRSSIEENHGALKLANEVLQIEVDLSHLDVAKQHLKNYNFFSRKRQECLKPLLNEEVAKADLYAETTDDANCFQKI